MRISISTAVTATGLALIAGVLLTLLTGAEALNRLKVNGPIYEDIIYSKDLIADILPPPLYVIESYALANESTCIPTRWPSTPRVKVLKEQYETPRLLERRQTSRRLKTKLLDDVLVKGDDFWREMQGVTLPALQANDRNAIVASLSALRVKFHRHEPPSTNWWKWAMSSARRRKPMPLRKRACCRAQAMASGSPHFALHCIHPLHQTPRHSPAGRYDQAMTRMASGDLKDEPPHLARQDEIGAMAKALAVFRDAGLPSDSWKRSRGGAPVERSRTPAARA